MLVQTGFIAVRKSTNFIHMYNTKNYTYIYTCVAETVRKFIETYTEIMTFLQCNVTAVSTSNR
jgi:hypothetical protein